MAQHTQIIIFQVGSGSKFNNTNQVHQFVVPIFGNSEEPQDLGVQPLTENHRKSRVRDDPTAREKKVTQMHPEPLVC